MLWKSEVPKWDSGFREIVPCTVLDRYLFLRESDRVRHAVPCAAGV